MPGELTDQQIQDEYNEDWVKLGTWDFPRTWPEFLMSVDLTNQTVERKREVLQWMTHLPAWHAAPREIRVEAAKLLRGGGSDTSSTPAPSS